MDNAITKIVGKTIKGVVVKESDFRQPKSQVFLVFDDDTHYEFNSQSIIKGIKGVDQGGMDKVKKYTPDSCKIILEYGV